MKKTVQEIIDNRDPLTNVKNIKTNNQNHGGATSLQAVEQDCPLVDIFHLPRISNQGVGVAAPPTTLNTSGAGLQLEMVYHVTTLSGL